jgi:putative salt-induced outer membrane protein YdiY
MKYLALALLLSSAASAQYSNESELTVILNGGNTEQETWYTKTMNSYLKDKNTFKLGGHYSYGKADGLLNTRNNDINARYERAFAKEWSLFTAGQREEDFFASIDYRWNYDLGGIYKFMTTDKQKLHAEAGYRRTLEADLSGRKTNGSKLRLYTEYTRQHSESVFFKLWVEALPNISESDDWQINFEPSLNVTMSKMFAIKMAYLHKYDNEPTLGSKNSDYQYTTSLIAKF